MKNLQCNWTVGYKWSTALILSMTLGGFGADRFAIHFSSSVIIKQEMSDSSFCYFSDSTWAIGKKELESSSVLEGLEFGR